jgi:hypothetical protein
MRITVLGITLLAVAASGFVQAGEVNMPYSPTPERPVTGTMIERPVITGALIPLDKSYAELSPEQQSMVKANYGNLGASDEPPYPLNGLKSISQRIANADVSAAVDGELVMQVDVSSSGDATTVATVHSPNPNIARVAAIALQREKYKPGICHGQPCAMPFVYHVQLSSPR